MTNLYEQTKNLKRFNAIYKEYKNKAERLERQFKNIQRLTQDVTYTDVKLHDIAYQLNDSDENWRMFEIFCSDELEEFNKVMDDLDLRTEHIGRTSSFRFYKENQLYDFDIYDMKDDTSIFDTLGYDTGFSEYLEAFNLINSPMVAHDHLTHVYGLDLNDSEQLDELESDLFSEYEEIQDALIEYLQVVKAVKRGYNFVDSYKKHQLEHWKDFKDINDFE